MRPVVNDTRGLRRGDVAAISFQGDHQQLEWLSGPPADRVEVRSRRSVRGGSIIK